MLLEACLNIAAVATHSREWRGNKQAMRRLFSLSAAATASQITHKISYHQERTLHVFFVVFHCWYCCWSYTTAFCNTHNKVTQRLIDY
jgi:hypothetical protein